MGRRGGLPSGRKEIFTTKPRQGVRGADEPPVSGGEGASPGFLSSLVSGARGFPGFFLNTRVRIDVIIMSTRIRLRKMGTWESGGGSSTPLTTPWPGLGKNSLSGLRSR